MPVTSVLLKRLGDPDCSVISAALSAVSSPTFRDIAVREWPQIIVMISYTQPGYGTIVKGQIDNS